MAKTHAAVCFQPALRKTVCFSLVSHTGYKEWKGEKKKGEKIE
jgi:hypothetical protein